MLCGVGRRRRWYDGEGGHAAEVVQGDEWFEAGESVDRVESNDVEGCQARTSPRIQREIALTVALSDI